MDDSRNRWTQPGTYPKAGEGVEDDPHGRRKYQDLYWESVRWTLYEIRGRGPIIGGRGMYPEVGEGFQDDSHGRRKQQDLYRESVRWTLHKIGGRGPE